MNQQDDDKATAKLLLSTDEAVAEKIRRVLMDHPAILRETIQNMQMQDERTRYDMQRQIYEQQIAAHQQRTATQAQIMRNAYGRPGAITQVDQDSLQKSFWSNVFGGSR